MAVKFGLLALALFAVWMILFRTGRGVSHPKPEKPPKRTQALEPCPDCGVYRLPGGACDCDPRSTPRD